MIELDHVDVSYGRLKALEDVSCSITEGSVGLLGPNGAGKSTLLKTALGFIRADRGSVRMFGKEMPRHALDARQRLGYMPERECVSPKVSAVSFLTYCGCLFGMSRVDAMERAHEVLNFIGMGDNRYRLMETYSTGMLQRVKFAQALVHDPKLLLLDEPTNGLDPEGRIEMLELIKELGEKRGITVILSSHLLPDVAHVCSRIIVIGRGRVLRDGHIDELTSRREGMYEIRVHDKRDAVVGALEEQGCACRQQQDGTMLVTAKNGMTAQDFFAIAQAQGTQLRHFTPVRHRLEEAFLEALGEKRKG